VNQAATASVEDDFRSLAAAAIRLSAGIVDNMPPEQQVALGGALQAGARLFLEFGPLPLLGATTLYLVDENGRRELGAFAVSSAGHSARRAGLELSQGAGAAGAAAPVAVVSSLLGAAILGGPLPSIGEAAFGDVLRALRELLAGSQGSAAARVAHVSDMHLVALSALNALSARLRAEAQRAGAIARGPLQ